MSIDLDPRPALAPEPSSAPAARTSVRTEPSSTDSVPVHARRTLSRSTAEQRFELVGCWVAALALSWLICGRLMPWDGPLVFVAVTIVLGIVLLAVITAIDAGRPEVVDRIVTTVITLAAGLVGLALVSTVLFIFAKGYKPLLHLNTFFDDMAGVGPRDPLDRGGVAHAIVGSLIEVGIAIVVAIPLGIGTAIYMTEIGGRFARIVRTIVEAMTALPSIVAGLFIYTTLIVGLGVPRSGLAAAMALGVMMLPIIARASDVVLRVVPGNLREASLALGASRWRTVWHIVLPTARPGLATAVILGVARGIGETSPVLLTSGAASFMVTNPTEGVMNSLPLFIFSTVRSGEPIYIERAYGAAAILLAIVLVLFVTARLLARPRKGSR
ncbi:phosphate ABC transporter permease PstA [Aeromicrobium sp. CFBP 8757]|uniref:phosphate ABC transporter permease PstA n=1 Tax=Aeromicrobium sp. CFBP 8757 TaxID=2775288 RepID=UPI001785C013|nr:phosphate ABC transporter permease PstA [Aeromicrobium sp. CFBP 8757]MBD8606470.1 phosphate ABC transporter permease PstA [Aeromicrobium sp. CFBP 8757]